MSEISVAKVGIVEGDVRSAMERWLKDSTVATVMMLALDKHGRPVRVASSGFPDEIADDFVEDLRESLMRIRRGEGLQ